MSVNTKGRGGGEGGGLCSCCLVYLVFSVFKTYIVEAFYLSDCLFISLRILTKLYICLFFFTKRKKSHFYFEISFFLKIYNTVSIFKVSLKKPVGNKTVILCVIPALVSESDLSKLKINLLLLLFFKELNLF